MTMEGSYFTNLECVNGMLDRDIRTAKLPYYIWRTLKSSVSGVNITSPRDRSPKHTNKYDVDNNEFFHHARRKKHLWKRLRNVVLIVGVYLSLINVRSTSSAPTSKQKMEDNRNQSKPNWVNPCDSDFRSDNSAIHNSNSEASDEYLLNSIVHQAKIAFSRAEEFKEDFIRRNFNTDFDSLHTSWKHSYYDWLPTKEDIPKNLGENLPPEYLKTLALDDTLINTYESLQKINVGLEQIKWDQEDEKGPHLENFTTSEDYLKLLLCEIQTAINEHGLTPRDDVDRKIMGDEFRRMHDTSSKNLRNWLIYRDYMNALEYVIEVFSFLKKNL